ncbi:hypothetical protein Mpsy_1367 [Methanolobus psychrophilus R15]|nr:hypothetical protein Mpsy_1367 [Methanolobus psychrophilus R15]
MREIIKKTNLPITILLMLLTLAAQGVYTTENFTVPGAQHLDFDDIRNKSREMMAINIESIGTMQSSEDYEELEGGRLGNEAPDKENNGLLSGLINKIKAIFS